MTERTFRIFLGAFILAALYFELPMAVHGLIVLLLFEGITNWRIPILVSRFSGSSNLTNNQCELSLGKNARFDFEAERALRLVVAVFLIVSFMVFSKDLWFFPWFIGFALFGAGLSGICPMMMGFRWAGFR